MSYNVLKTPPDYLQVRDKDGFLLGLMKGPFQLKRLEHGLVSFVVQERSKWPKISILHRIDIDVAVWAEGENLYWCLRPNSEQIPLLKKIKHFR